MICWVFCVETSHTHSGDIRDFTYCENTGPFIFSNWKVSLVVCWATSLVAYLMYPFLSLKSGQNKHLKIC